MTHAARILPICLIALSCVGCNEGAEQRKPTPEPAQQSVLSDEQRALRSAREAITTHALTTLSLDCVKLGIDSTSADGYELTAYEIHDAKCGGDPQTAPRLFSMRIERDGKIWTDAQSDAGELEPLP